LWERDILGRPYCRLFTTENPTAILPNILSRLRRAWSLANALCKSLALAKNETQRDLQQSYIMRAMIEAEKLRAEIEELARDVKK